ncbi:hypothetical protein BH18ACI4_BH18ACI4_27120 [soil metagenome]
MVSRAGVPYASSPIQAVIRQSEHLHFRAHQAKLVTQLLSQQNVQKRGEGVEVLFEMVNTKVIVSDPDGQAEQDDESKN